MTELNRRGFLNLSLGAACSAAASPLLTPVVAAAAPGENRLVVIILRGAMDGLGVFSPYGDRGFAALRPSIGLTPDAGLIDLDGRFGMHEGLSALHPLWRQGDLAIAHAVSTPYRDKRSHFDGQDILEAGTPGIDGARDGWVNRTLVHLKGSSADTVFSVGQQGMLLTSGANRTRSWAPGAKLPFSEDARQRLAIMYAKDPLFADAAADAVDLAATTGDKRAQGGKAAEVSAEYAAARLKEEARIVAFSIGAWDTHVRQPVSLRGPLAQLSGAITTLKSGLGAHWDKTLVIAMTEFGRTARENGGRGTDHGTGGAALFAGGALKGGKVYGDWPGIGEGALYKGRDLMPTRDLRAYPAWALSAMFGLSRTALERDVFPGLDMGADPGFIA